MAEAAIASGFECNQLTHGPRVDLDAPITTTSTPASQAGRVDRVDSGLFLPARFNYNLYAPIRLYDLASEDKEMVTKLVELKTHVEILSILELEDESFELGVLKTHIPELKQLLGEFIKCSVDWEHRPFDPNCKDVQSFCANHPELSGDHTKAKARIRAQLCKRVEEVIKNGWPMQKNWYSHLVGLIPN